LERWIRSRALLVQARLTSGHVTQYGRYRSPPTWPLADARLTGVEPPAFADEKIDFAGCCRVIRATRNVRKLRGGSDQKAVKTADQRATS
jgi:hypothetical protein